MDACDELVATFSLSRSSFTLYFVRSSSTNFSLFFSLSVFEMGALFSSSELTIFPPLLLFFSSLTLELCDVILLRTL